MERWAELRREHFVRGVAIKELAAAVWDRSQHGPAALRSEEPPGYQRPGRRRSWIRSRTRSMSFCARIRGLPGVRVRELIEPLGFVGGKTIVDDYLREVRPLFLKPRTFQRTVYRPGEVCQFDLWHTSEPVPVGHGQTRRGMWSWRRSDTRGLARARWCSAARRAMCCGGWAGACGRWARCPNCWSGTGRGVCTPAVAARPRAMPRSAGS